MIFQAEVIIKNADPKALASDFRAVCKMLEKRRARRDAIRPMSDDAIRNEAA